MGRIALLLLFLAACPKKQAEPEPEPVGSSGPPPSGRSVTKVAEDGDTEGSGSEGSGSEGSGGTAGRLAKHTAPAVLDDAGVKTPRADAALWGGNGSPAYRADNGELRGPGGPAFMGRGPECNAERDHCLREGIWFAVGNLVAGKLYRATPVFEFEGKWYNWRGKEEQFAMRFKTKVGTKATLKAGDPIIWYIEENSNRKFADNEYDALTSSRWEAGIIESVGVEALQVKGWTYGAVPFDTTRVIIERQ